MDTNILPPSTPPSAPPNKRRKTEIPDASCLPSFEEEPHTSPAKIGELGLHVLLSPKKQYNQSERASKVARTLTFGDETKPLKEEVDTEDAMEYWDRPRESMYVTAFNTAVDTVLEREGHLFSQEEMGMINLYRNLPCILIFFFHELIVDESMFLYVRLFLRKKAQWFRVDKLGYYSDISNISTASTHLTLPHISLAQSQHILTDIDEALSLLSLDELKEFAKESKCSGTTKAQISASISNTAKTQAGLSKCSNGLLTLNFTEKGSVESRTPHYVRKILQKTGPLIRLMPAPVALFHRLHTVFFRSTNYDEKSLATLILAKISKRNFPEYVVERTSNVFHSRAELLEYERAIVYKKEVDDILEGMSGVLTQEGLQRVKQVFGEIYPRWKEIIRQERGKEHFIHEDNWRTEYYLRRYTPGWVYTRLVFKGAYVLSRFHEYEREWEVLSELLDQKLFRRGRRGEWWERRALVEVLYLHDISEVILGTLHVAIRKIVISSPSKKEMAETFPRNMRTRITRPRHPHYIPCMDPETSFKNRETVRRAESRATYFCTCCVTTSY